MWSGRETKKGREGNRAVREERASLRRAGPRTDPRRLGLSAGGNRVARPGPCPPRGYRPAPGSQRSLPHHLSKDLTTKEEPGGKVGEGRFKVVQVLPRKGMYPPLASFQFLRVSGSDPRTRSGRYQSPDNSHAAQTYVHTCAPSSRYTEARTAPPLFLPNRPSDGANRGERGSPAPLPWKTQVPTSNRPLPLSFFPSAFPTQVSPSSGFL